MVLSNNGVAFIASNESFVTHPYQDVRGVWTIGYGTTHYPNGKEVTEHDAPISMSKAMGYLAWHCDTYVLPRLKALVKVQLTQNQFDSICDFCYNEGVTNFANSTLLKLINRGGTDVEGIKAAFMAFNKVRVDGKLERNQGLANRRKKEIELYFKIN